MIGFTGDMVHVVVHREEMGGMMTEEISDMMMMVVPNQIFQQEINHLYGYCFPSLIRKFTKLTSGVSKDILDDC